MTVLVEIVIFCLLSICVGLVIEGYLYWECRHSGYQPKRQSIYFDNQLSNHSHP